MEVEAGEADPQDAFIVWAFVKISVGQKSLNYILEIAVSEMNCNYWNKVGCSWVVWAEKAHTEDFAGQTTYFSKC